MLQVGGQLIELALPVALVEVDPVSRLAHRRRDEPRAARAAVASDLGQAGTLEHTDVLGDGGQGHVEVRRELTDRALSRGEPGEDLAACRIGERREGEVEIRLVNHLV